MSADKLSDSERRVKDRARQLRDDLGRSAHAYFNHNDGTVSLKSASKLYDELLDLCELILGERRAG